MTPQQEKKMNGIFAFSVVSMFLTIIIFAILAANIQFQGESNWLVYQSNDGQKTCTINVGHYGYIKAMDDCQVTLEPN